MHNESMSLPEELSVVPKTRIYAIVNLQHQSKPGDVCKKLLDEYSEHKRRTDNSSTQLQKNILSLYTV